MTHNSDEETAKAHNTYNIVPWGFILRHVGRRDILILRHMLKYRGNPAKTCPRIYTAASFCKVVVFAVLCRANVEVL